MGRAEAVSKMQVLRNHWPGLNSLFQVERFPKRKGLSWGNPWLSGETVACIWEEQVQSPALHGSLSIARSSPRAPSLEMLLRIPSLN